MIRRYFLTITLTITFLFSASTFANPIILRSLHVQNSTNTVSATFNLSSVTQYRVFMMHHPDRFVVDLKNVKTFQQLHFPEYAKSAINSFRYATHRDGMFRMVFGLNSSVKPQTRVLPLDLHHQARLQITFSKANNIALPILPPPTKEKVHHQKAVMTDSDFDRNNKNHRNIIIVIDPGHGGKDPGASGINGTKEKNIVLSISKIIEQDIDKQPGYHAELTRTGDYYLTLRQRLSIARKDKADMFVAIHADKWRNTQAHGFSVFALSQRGATSEAARWLAHSENKSELMGGVKLQDQSHLLKSVLINLSQSATVRDSLQIGTNVLHAVKPIASLHHNTVEQAAFVVLKSPDIPSLLLETGFLSNPREEYRLSNSTFQHQLAQSITQGIDQYFSKYPPRGTWVSYWRMHHAHS
ncbi:MAG: N-acetylmuramoyl-L-alanine amidase [Gammaproteobacteria bacterium]|nr:N-acetylmuramoyl-L-alanine amidase [Gammaproteobacteria bacterium]